MQPVAGLELGLPKFSFSKDFDLKEHLSSIGMPDAFDPNRADFSGMTGGRDLYIDTVLHQAFVAVDEEGTEAAAATAVIMAPTSAMLSEVTLTIDRPFIFMIRDRPSGQILFVGRVLNPVE
jgi:serpin B